jgi:hypothetical protein
VVSFAGLCRRFAAIHGQRAGDGVPARTHKRISGEITSRESASVHSEKPQDHG